LSALTGNIGIPFEDSLNAASIIMLLLQNKSHHLTLLPI
jgi:hypothetical protein